MAQEPKRAPHLLSHQEDRLWQWVERYVQRKRQSKYRVQVGSVSFGCYCC